MQETLDKSKLDQLYEEIVKSGRWAEEMQGKVSRQYKADGSVLTEVDLAISHRIINRIESLFPECGIISEEETTEYKKDAPFTFVLDPIDGTDVYSLGLPSFAVALGIIDRYRKPIGAFISAPRFGIAEHALNLRLDPYDEMKINGKYFEFHGDKDHIKQITMGSKCQRELDFTEFTGKARTFGSTIIHLILPILVPDIQASCNQPCFIWDIASAHAVLLKYGMDISYADGQEIIYDDDFVRNKKPLKGIFYAGTLNARKELAQSLPLLKKDKS